MKRPTFRKEDRARRDNKKRHRFLKSNNVLIPTPVVHVKLTVLCFTCMSYIILRIQHGYTLYLLLGGKCSDSTSIDVRK
jgi:hypothetical protein